MKTQDDAELVREVLAGRREAFTTLVHRYQDFAYGVAIGILSDFDLARDVVQEAFLSAYCDLGKLRDPDRFAGWLYGIVRHMSLRARRELENVRAVAEELVLTGETVARPPSPDQAVEEDEKRELVQQALQGLSEKSREAVSLYYVDGMSYADIAGLLDVTETAVQGRLQRARAKLREELAMVKEAFGEEELSEDFSDEVKRLLDTVAVRAEERRQTVKRLTEIGAGAVDPLCEALEDPRDIVRAIAARTLCEIGDARALQPLLRGLYGHHKWAWKGDVFRDGRVLGIPGAREAFLSALRDGTRRERGVACRALSRAKGDDEVFDALGQVFRDTEATTWDTRYSAMEALCRLCPESAVEFVTEALNGESTDLRRLASWTAVRQGLVPPIEACLKGFTQAVEWWGRRCAGTLVLRHGEAGKAVLERLMREGSPDERCTAAMAMAQEGSGEALEILREELLGVPKDRKWGRAVSRTLAGQYSDQLAEWLEADGPRFVKGVPTMMWALARSRRAPVGPMIQNAFREGTPGVRGAACRILARKEGAAFIPELRKCLAEGRPRKVAQEAFWQMHRLRDAARPVALEMLDSDLWTERKAAVCLLRRWGVLTPEQRTRAEVDPHVAVRLSVD